MCAGRERPHRRGLSVLSLSPVRAVGEHVGTVGTCGARKEIMLRPEVVDESVRRKHPVVLASEVELTHQTDGVLVCAITIQRRGLPGGAALVCRHEHLAATRPNVAEHACAALRAGESSFDVAIATIRARARPACSQGRGNEANCEGSTYFASHQLCPPSSTPSVSPEPSSPSLVVSDRTGRIQCDVSAETFWASDVLDPKSTRYEPLPLAQ